jgi:flagellar hook-basal body complex protein FliE
VVASIGAATAVLPTAMTAPTKLAEAAASSAAGKSDFGSVVTGALEQLSATQQKADGLAVQAATGTLTDVHDYTIAATEATLATELTVAVRNKAVEAFNQIMSMPL